MILYHCTDEVYKNQILAEGLRIEKSLSGGKLFLSKYPEYCFGNTCFSVDVKGLRVEQTINNWEHICKESISPDRIKYFGFCEM